MFDKNVFEHMGTQRPEGRFISIRMLCGWKGDVIKSRLCLQDVAYTKASGGELFAATPSLMALRAGLTIASTWMNLELEGEIGAVAADVTQAFVHAGIYEAVITRVPHDMNKMEINLKE